MRCFLVASILLAATTAFAGSPTRPISAGPVAPAKAAPVPAHTTAGDARQMHTDDCARARKQNRTCVIDMGKGDTIDGTSPTAGGSTIGAIVPPKETSLIHIRRDFIVEILKTAEDSVIGY